MNNETKHSRPPEDEMDDEVYSNATVCKILLAKLEEMLTLPKNRKIFNQINKKDKPKS